MKIAIGADHKGFVLKQTLMKQFSNIKWIDVGTNNGEDRVDYPVYTKKVCDLIVQKDVAQGVLICGSGVGMSIAANRFASVYAALCWNDDVARCAREDDKANVLVLPAQFISPEKAVAIVTVWQEAVFKGGRYQARLDLLDQY